MKNKKNVKVGYIYILQSEAYYKVGISRNHPNRRRQQLQTGNPNIIRLVKYYKRKDYKSLEQKIHKKLSKYRVNGEWFKCQLDDITNLIERKLFMGEVIKYVFWMTFAFVIGFGILMLLVWNGV